MWQQHPILGNELFFCLHGVFFFFVLIRQTLKWSSKQNKNKEYEWEKIVCFFEWKTPGAQMKAFPFLFLSQFLLEALAYFKSLPKKIARGQKWPICILKTRQRARSRRGEREREKMGGRERNSPSSWFEDDLKETIMSISWRCHAHYAGLIAEFAATKTDYFPTCQTAPWRGRERAREVGRGNREKKCAS